MALPPSKKPVLELSKKPTLLASPPASQTDRIEAMIKRLRDSRNSPKTNFLIYGGAGSGKTMLASTARTPILVHSFDVGGWSSPDHAAAIENGTLLVDSSFEVEDYRNPTAYASWEVAFNEILRTGIAARLGTYVIDSASSFYAAILDAIMAKKGKVGAQPSQPDYGDISRQFQNWLAIITSLPCDVIMTAHTYTNKDEETGHILSVCPSLTGQLKEIIGRSFDEFWYCKVQQVGKSSSYKVLINNNGIIQARSRLSGKGGALDQWEDPSITEILAKVGRDTASKPGFNEWI